MSGSEHRQKIVVGLIFNRSQDSILISRRPDEKDLGGLWEFPGGKSNPGESDFDTLSREIMEETGLSVMKARKISEIHHNYSGNKICLNAWIVDEWEGVVSGREGQVVNWSNIKGLSNYQFPEANRKLIKLVKLPLLYLITPDLPSYNDSFFRTLSGFLDNGLGLFQFRCPSLCVDEKLNVLEKLLKQCSPYDCKVILNGSYDEAKTGGAHGVHLSSDKLMQWGYHETIDDFYIAASCHNKKELEKARECNLDFCVLSPVNKTPSHSQVLPLGWQKMSDLLNSVNIPAYALGGVKYYDISRALMSGCYGISMISGVWGSETADKIIRQLGHRPPLVEANN